MIPENSTIPYFAVRSSCAEKNDKLGWTCGFSIQLDDIVMGVRCNDENVLSKLKSLLQTEGTPSEEREVGWLVSFRVGQDSSRKGTKNYHIVYQNWTRMARTLDLDEALLAFQRLCFEFQLNSGKELAKIFVPGVSVTTGDHQGVAVVAAPSELESVKAILGPKASDFLSYEYCVLDWKGQLCPAHFNRDPRATTLPLQAAKLNRVLIVDSNETGSRKLSTGEATVRMLPNAGGLSSQSAHMFTLAERLKDVDVWATSLDCLAASLPL